MRVWRGNEEICLGNVKTVVKIRVLLWWVPGLSVVVVKNFGDAALPLCKSEQNLAYLLALRRHRTHIRAKSLHVLVHFILRWRTNTTLASIERPNMYVFHGRKELKGFLELMIQQRYFRLLSMNSQIKSRWVRQLRGFCTPHVVIQGQCSHLLFLEQKWLCQFGHPCLSTTSWRVTWEKDTLWHCNFFDACFRKLKRPISKCNTYIFIPPLSFWQYAAAGNDVSENVPPLFLLLLDNLKLTESSP